MKITRANLFGSIFLFGLIVNIFVLFNVQLFYFRPILSFIFLTLVPGLLIMLAFRIKNLNFWEYLIYTVGFSIAFLMFAGLLVNWVLPLTNISKPLTLHPLMISFDLILSIMTGIAYFKNKGLGNESKLAYIAHYLKNKSKVNKIKLFNKWNVLSGLFFIIPWLFPVLSVLGAVSINNNGSNVFTMMMLGGIALYVLLVFIVKRKLNHNVYPYSLFFIATALLLMTSLRGWYITGHDIQREYYVFQLTKNAFHWDMSLFQNTYNACLSLNILPTIFSIFTSINDMYVFKVLFQLIFPFTAVAIYLIIRKYANNFISFLSAFFFITFPTFMNDMPMLNRQEISLLYFSLMILVLFNKNFEPKLKKTIFLLFGFSMVVSHYSTSYVSLALFLLTYIISLILKKGFINKKYKLTNFNINITGKMIMTLLAFSFIWNAQVTHTTQGLTNLISQTAQNIGKSFSQDTKSEDVLYSIFNWKKIEKSKLFNDYVKEESDNVLNNKYPDTYFEKKIIEKYKPMYTSDATIPLTLIGRKLNNFGINPFSLNFLIKQMAAKVIQILTLIGFIVIFIKRKVILKNLDTEYIILSFISIALLGLFILLPMFSVEYGMLRFFQQTLTILALPTVIGSLWFFIFFKVKVRQLFSLIFFLIFFLSLSGFIPQITGGFYPSMNLNNQGSYFDAFYNHKSELTTMDWLSKNLDKNYPLQASKDAAFKTLILSGFSVLEKILPVTVEKDAYVYLDYSVVKNKKSTAYYKGNSFVYEYPVSFLDDNKNLIFNNSEVKIYK